MDLKRRGIFLRLARLPGVHKRENEEKKSERFQPELEPTGASRAPDIGI